MFLAVLDGASRFEGAHQVMGYLGMVPREMSSGEKQMRGHISKAGHGQMRVLLVQAAMGIMKLKKPRRRGCTSGPTRSRSGEASGSPRWRWRDDFREWAMLREGTQYQAEPVKPRGKESASQGQQPSQSLAA